MIKDYNNLFASTASYYARFRPGYPQELIDHIVEKFELDGTGRLIDLGCGTGQLTIPLAPFFESAVGLDPDAEMLKEAKQEADKRKIRNIGWANIKAEEISNKLGVFKLATMGISFHWMEQELVLRKLYDVIEEGGGVAVIGDTSPVWKIDTEEEWKVVRRELIQKYLGEERRAGQGKYVRPTGRFEDLLESSKFSNLDKWEYRYTRTRDIDSIVGHLYSTSYANKRLLGDKAQAFEAELREKLLRLEPTGSFIESGISQALLVWK